MTQVDHNQGSNAVGAKVLHNPLQVAQGAWQRMLWRADATGSSKIILLILLAVVLTGILMTKTPAAFHDDYEIIYFRVWSTDSAGLPAVAHQASFEAPHPLPAERRE